jgi:hypothetical protein
MARQASDAARSRIWFHHTLRYGLAEGRRGLTQGYRRILDLFPGHGCLDFPYETLEGTQRRTITVVPLHSLTGSANRRFMYNRHNRLLWKGALFYHTVLRPVKVSYSSKGQTCVNHHSS